MEDCSTILDLKSELNTDAGNVKPALKLNSTISDLKLANNLVEDLVGISSTTLTLKLGLNMDARNVQP